MASWIRRIHPIKERYYFSNVPSGSSFANQFIDADSFRCAKTARSRPYRRLKYGKVMRQVSEDGVLLYRCKKGVLCLEDWEPALREEVSR